MKNIILSLVVTLIVTTAITVKAQINPCDTTYVLPLLTSYDSEVCVNEGGTLIFVSGFSLYDFVLIDTVPMTGIYHQPTAGTYIVSAGIAECIVYDTIQIDYYPVTVTQFSAPYQLCFGETGEVEIITDLPYTQVIWNDGFDNMQAGSGIYGVRYVDYQGCIVVSYGIILEQTEGCELGIEEENIQEVSFEVYDFVGRKYDKNDLPIGATLVRIYSDGRKELTVRDY